MILNEILCCTMDIQFGLGELCQGFIGISDSARLGAHENQTLPYWTLELRPDGGLWDA